MSFGTSCRQGRLEMQVSQALIPADRQSIIGAIVATGVALTYWPSELPILELAAEFGTPRPSRSGGPLVDEIKPVTRDVAANVRSLSATWGLAAFPFHTD